MCVSEITWNDLKWTNMNCIHKLIAVKDYNHILNQPHTPWLKSTRVYSFWILLNNYGLGECHEHGLWTGITCHSKMAVDVSWLCSNRSIGTETISGQNCFLYHRYGLTYIGHTAILHLSWHWISEYLMVKLKQAELVALLKWDYPFVWTELLVYLFECKNRVEFESHKERAIKGLEHETKNNNQNLLIHVYLPTIPTFYRLYKQQLKLLKRDKWMTCFKNQPYVIISSTTNLTIKHLCICYLFNWNQPLQEWLSANGGKPYWFWMNLSLSRVLCITLANEQVNW